MKRIVFIALLLLTVSAHAQFHLGVKGGVSITNLDDRHEGAVAGWYIGPTTEFTFPILGLGIDAAAVYHKVDYSQKDTMEESQSIEIPVRLKYSFGLGRTLGGFIAAGPQFTFLLEDTYFNDFATSLNAAIGIKLLKHLQVEAGYLFPLGRTMKGMMIGIADPNSPPRDMSYDIKRKGWQLSLAYFF